MPSFCANSAELLREFGAEVIQEADSVTVKKSGMKAIEINASQIPDLVPALAVCAAFAIPDLVPALAVCAAFAEGTTKITNAERLRIKESDRLKSTAALINSLGGEAVELPDGLEITGTRSLIGGTAKGFNDHRIVMSAAVCAAGSQNPIICTDTDALSVNKSYPQFFEDYNSVGGKAEII